MLHHLYTIIVLFALYRTFSTPPFPRPNHVDPSTPSACKSPLSRSLLPPSKLYQPACTGLLFPSTLGSPPLNTHTVVCVRCRCLWTFKVPRPPDCCVLPSPPSVPPPPPFPSPNIAPGPTNSPSPVESPRPPKPGTSPIAPPPPPPPDDSCVLIGPSSTSNGAGANFCGDQASCLDIYYNARNVRQSACLSVKEPLHLTLLQPL